VGDVGDWACQPLDPASDCGFVEGNASQYVWMVPHDLPKLFERMGGTGAAITRLDRHFTELNAGTRREFFYIGNEPEHGTPWTYNVAGAPWKTQAVIRRIVDEEFSTSPGGLPGNDDLGATSAWLVWAYLGMYPVIPGMDELALHTPRFPRAVVHLANGNTLTIVADGAGMRYIQSLEIDGTACSTSFVRFSDVSRGATLRYSLGDTPNESWGSVNAARPAARD